MDWWQQVSAVAWRFLEEHGLLGAFLYLLVEEAGTPVPIPGDLIMLLAGMRAAQGELSLFQVLLVMELATVLGASALYWLSARAGRTVVYRLGRYVGLTPARLDTAAEKLNHSGASAVIVGRLTPGLRMATPIICGLTRFPFRIYLPAMAFAGFIYLLMYTLAGYFFGPRMIQLLGSIELPFGLLVTAGLLLLLTFWVVRVGWRSAPPEQCPDVTERLQAGAASGLVATLTSGLLVNVLIHLAGLASFDAPGTGLARLLGLIGEQVARAPGPSALLLLPAFLGVGATLGAIYGAWLGNLSYGVGPWRGASFALLPLAASLTLVLPLAGAGFGGLGLGTGLVPAIGETLRHLAFGLVLGTLYPALARPRRSRRPPTAAQATTGGAVYAPSDEGGFARWEARSGT